MAHCLPGMASSVLRSRAEVRKESVCSGCLKSREELAGGADFQYCSGCKGEKYCSRSCQKQHWGSHKAVCRRIAASRAGNDAMSAASGSSLPDVGELEKWTVVMRSMFGAIFSELICKEAVKRCGPVSRADLCNLESPFALMTQTLALDRAFVVSAEYVRGRPVPFQVRHYEVKLFEECLPTLNVDPEVQGRYRNAPRTRDDHILFYTITNVNKAMNSMLPTLISKQCLPEPAQRTGRKLTMEEMMMAINTGAGTS